MLQQERGPPWAGRADACRPIDERSRPDGGRRDALAKVAESLAHCSVGRTTAGDQRKRVAGKAVNGAQQFDFRAVRTLSSETKVCSSIELNEPSSASAQVRTRVGPARFACPIVRRESGRLSRRASPT